MGHPGKRFLIISRKSPYGSACAKEALDLALTAAAFEQKVSLLFMDDGVFQLLKDQNTELLGAKNLSSTLPVLPMYDVENIYVDQYSLNSRNLKQADLVIATESLDDEALTELFENNDVVLSF
jgi:tRNA 2-thiouridine synthesizing protein C